MNTSPKNNFTQHTFFYQNKPFRMLQAMGETWFVAADICTALGLPQVSRAVRRIDPVSAKMVKVPLPQQPNRAVAMNVVDAAGLEQMTLLGTKQATGPFRRWLRREVIPIQQWCEGAEPPPTAAALPTDTKLPRFTRRDLLALAIEAEEECDALRQNDAAWPPRAAAYDRLAKNKDSRRSRRCDDCHVDRNPAGRRP